MQGVGRPGPGLAGGRLRGVPVVSIGGETEEEKIRVDMLENEVMDTGNQLARVCYSPDFVSCLLLIWMGRL